MKTFGIALCVLILAVSCSNNEQSSTDKQVKKEDTSTVSKAPAEFSSEINFAYYCMEQLQKSNFSGLSKYVNDNGVLFSPYAHVDTTTAPILSISALNKHKNSPVIWGLQDGTGDTLKYSVSQFVDKYILPFKDSSKNVTTRVFTANPSVHGNELHNIHELYPGDKFVEFYYPATSASGMDWRAIILVVGKDRSHYILKAVVSNEWTI